MFNKHMVMSTELIGISVFLNEKSNIFGRRVYDEHSRTTYIFSISHKDAET